MNSKITLFKRMLSHYTNPYLSLEQRFVKPEIRNSKKLLKLQEARFAGTTLKNFVKYATNRGVKIFPFEDDVTTLLGMVTDKDCDDETIEDAKDFLLSMYPHRIKSIDIKDRKKIEITLTNDKITCYTLSAVFPQLKEVCPYMETNERQSRCHESSMRVVFACPDTTCVTGVQTILSSNIYVLHSWVELELDGREKVFDINENIFMNKEDYYKLFMVKPLERITHKQLWDDSAEISKLTEIDKRYGKLYLCSRQEALRLAKRLPNNKTQGETSTK